MHIYIISPFSIEGMINNTYNRLRLFLGLKHAYALIPYNFKY